MRCAVCVDAMLCVDCFAGGIEYESHKRTHAYRVMRPFCEPLYVCDWSADEEYLLLSGILLYGLGNWPSISDRVGFKSAQQCEDHFFEVYTQDGGGALDLYEGPAAENKRMEAAKGMFDPAKLTALLQQQPPRRRQSQPSQQVAESEASRPVPAGKQAGSGTRGRRRSGGVKGKKGASVGSPVMTTPDTDASLANMIRDDEWEDIWNEAHDDYFLYMSDGDEETPVTTVSEAQSSPAEDKEKGAGGNAGRATSDEKIAVSEARVRKSSRAMMTGDTAPWKRKSSYIPSDMRLVAPFALYEKHVR